MRIITALALFFCIVPLIAREGEAAEERSTPSLQHRIAGWIHPSIGDHKRVLHELVYSGFGGRSFRLIQNK